MRPMKEIKAIVRTERVEPLVRALRKADVRRFHVSRMHALGGGANPPRRYL